MVVTQRYRQTHLTIRLLHNKLSYSHQGMRKSQTNAGFSQHSLLIWLGAILNHAIAPRPTFLQDRSSMGAILDKPRTAEARILSSEADIRQTENPVQTGTHHHAAGRRIRWPKERERRILNFCQCLALNRQCPKPNMSQHWSRLTSHDDRYKFTFQVPQNGLNQMNSLLKNRIA